MGAFYEKLDQLSRWAIELQSIAQDGIEYGHDRFDRERYQQIREIATKMMAAKTGEPIDVIKGLFSSDDGYQTLKYLLEQQFLITKNFASERVYRQFMVNARRVV
ncbi:NUDIX hydrolase N-terminal domain-containing protein [Lactobacillus sp. R2/2]|nr:NUDIX hydrolase N-terminal domain-containing protein [Lactobacillus sp. R2/2]